MSSQISDISSKNLNIICFDVPFPADYGGAIEEFYKLKAFHQLGVKIYLHCFIYGDRIKQKELEKYCEQVFYYERKRSLKDVFSNIPFIVKSRMHPELLQNLLSNDFPVLFDATHTTGFIDHPQLKERKKIVRLHNIEWIYYRILFDNSYSLKERLFYFSEYKKLREYDKILVNADVLTCLSQTDLDYYSEKFPGKKITLDHVFHENESVTCKPGKGNYLLYHGNLSILDNYMSVIDLLNTGLKDYKHPVVLAGKNPDKTLMDFVKNKSNIQLIPNPSNEQLNELIQDAQICLAIASNPSGVKLKLINSLFKARFVVSNSYAVEGSNLDVLCVIPGNGGFASTIDNLMEQTFNEREVELRKSVLSEKYDNLKNAENIIQTIFP